MKWAAIGALAIVAAVVTLVLITRITVSGDLTPKEKAHNRRVYAESLQDSMRTKGFGPGFTAKTVTDDDSVLEVDVDRCNRELLDKLVAAPEVRRALDQFAFSSVTCKGNTASVRAPWAH